MAEPQFNLLDEAWIPVIWRQRPADVADEESDHTPPRKRTHLDEWRSEIGILDALEHAESIRELADSSPIVNLALLRFLIAFLHASGVVRDDEASAWQLKISKYTKEWRDRFSLFHDTHPFLQFGRKDSQNWKGAGSLMPHFTQGTNISHFAHCADHRFGLLPDAAARGLLSEALAPSNGKTGWPSNPAGNPVFAVPLGASLLETMRMSVPDFRRFQDDSPLWEFDTAPSLTDRDGKLGFLEGMLWPSRLIRLGQPNDLSGSVQSLVTDRGPVPTDSGVLRASQLEETGTSASDDSLVWRDPHGTSRNPPSPLDTDLLPLPKEPELPTYVPPSLKGSIQEHEVKAVRLVTLARRNKDWKFFGAYQYVVAPEAWAQKLAAITYARNRKKAAERAARRKRSEDQARKGALSIAFDSRFPSLILPHSQLRSEAALFISMLTSQSKEADGHGDSSAAFGTTEYSRLRLPITDDDADIVPLTDFLNDNVRNKALLTGRKRRWAWTVARLYARYPYHAATGSFARSMRSACRGKHRERAENLFLRLVACPLAQIPTLLEQLIQLFQSDRSKGQEAIDFHALLCDLLQIENHQTAIVARWYRDAFWQPQQGEEHGQIA